MISGSAKDGKAHTKQSSKYHYDVTPADLAKEQQAFQPGEGVSLQSVMLVCTLNILCRSVNW